jgi:hypothetical protein
MEMDFATIIEHGPVTLQYAVSLALLTLLILLLATIALSSRSRILAVLGIPVLLAGLFFALTLLSVALMSQFGVLFPGDEAGLLSDSPESSQVLSGAADRLTLGTWYLLSLLGATALRRRLLHRHSAGLPEQPPAVPPGTLEGRARDEA